MAAHRIHEQIIEVVVRGPEARQLARPVQDRLSALHRRKLVGVVDRVCTELSPGARPHRIESLELDLGVIALDELEEDFYRAFESALRRGLGDVLFELETRSAGEGEGRSAFELLEHFARTGTLPWWADTSQREIVADALRTLVDDASPRDAGRRLLLALSDSREALARLVRASEGRTLACLVERAFGARGASLTQVVAKLSSSLPEIPRALREAIWVQTLTRIGSSIDRAQLANELVELVTSVRPQWDRASLIEGLVEDDDELGIADDPGSPPLELPASEVGPRALARALLEALTVEARQTRVTDESSATRPAAREGEAVSPSPGFALPDRVRALAQALLANPLPDPALRELLRRLVFSDRTAARSTPTSTSTPTVEELVSALHEALEQLPRTEGPSRPALSTGTTTHSMVDDLAVDNAGLVILWPFLERLFQRTQLVLAKARCFVDDRARARAVNALQYIAKDELGAPEFAMPLNKILCGLEPHAPLDAEGLLEPLEPELLAECDRMLQAVIAHAEILRDVSIPQLRGSFLSREAVLGTRDGAWLLRVERQPHDLELDRFPWTWDWLSLPWMTTPLRVEW